MIRRYRWQNFTAAEIDSALPGGVAGTVLGVNPSYADIELLPDPVSGAAQADLDDFMSSAGWVFVEVDPTTRLPGGWANNTFWVDANNPSPNPDGTVLNPYTTIQAAIDAAEVAQDAMSVGNSSPADRAQTRQQIIVASGFYDEDLDILRGNTFIEFLAAGPVTLGDGSAGIDFQSTTTRNVTWLNSQAQEDADAGVANQNRRPQLVFGVYPQAGEMSSTHTAIASGWDITGDLILTTPGGAGDSTTCEMHLQNVKVRGSLDATADFGGRNCYFYRCFFDGAMTGTNIGGLLLQVCESCEFDGPTTVGSYGRMSLCEIDGGFTVSSFSPGIVPGGMFQCDFAGTFTGPASSLQLNGTTNYFFKTNGAVLAGGATKVILDDLVP